jgi:hypothetical protein
MTAPDPDRRANVRQALQRAGWQIDDERPDCIEASNGERYGVAVFFEAGRPVCVEYGDGKQNLQHSEAWDEAPGILAPEEAARLFSEEEGE